MSNIKSNLAQIQEKIEAACKRADRAPEEVKLICVSKTRTAGEINEAIALGVTDIGENKVQEVMDKFDSITPVKWHLIGHLQTNKVKYIIDKVDLIHSVDSYHLAEEINKRSAAAGKVMEVLIQINVAGEESKFGIEVTETAELVRSVAQNLSHVRIKGFMTIAPFDEDPENVRVFFREIKKIYDTYAVMKLEGTDFQYLSMGMSGDFEVAIEEGANMVRIGTAIFGARNYM